MIDPSRVPSPLPPSRRHRVNIEALSDTPVAPQGDQLISIRIEGLVGGAATDRVRPGFDEPFAIRDIMQVKESDGFRWIIGTTAGVCRRLRANEEAGVIVLVVTRS